MVFKSLYLFAFFSFLRSSNLLPHVATKFDHTRHLCRGDVIFDPHASIIVVKWSKTLQDRHKIATIAVPYLGDNLLCPVTAFKNLLMLTSSSNNNPLFQICKAGVWQPLTDSQARKHLKSLCLQLQLQKHFSFHDFRWGGASWAFNDGVHIQHIQPQGTWSSACVWKYIQVSPTAPSSV